MKEGVPEPVSTSLRGSAGDSNRESGQEEVTPRMGPLRSWLRRAVGPHHPDPGAIRTQCVESVSLPAHVLTHLYALPLAVLGLGWLIAVTDLARLGENWGMLLLFVVIVVLLRRWGIVLFVRADSGDEVEIRGALDGIFSWSAALLLGPTGVWVGGAGTLIDWFSRSRPLSGPAGWRDAGELSVELTGITASLVALAVHRGMGGALPLSGTTLAALTPAVVATTTRYFLCRVFTLPALVFWKDGSRQWPRTASFGPSPALVAGLSLLADSFAILTALLFVEFGLGITLFFAGGVLLTSLLASRLGSTAIRSRQRLRKLERLEQLGRDIIQTPVNPTTLSRILSKHVPEMFAKSQIEVRLFPDQIICRHPDGCSPLPEVAWDWLRTTSGAHCLLPGERIPWQEQDAAVDRPYNGVLLTAPILKSEGPDPIGGVALARETNATVGCGEVASALPAVQTLASQIGSALQGAELYRVEQELSLAGQIQSSFLPGSLPEIPGWQLRAVLKPAHQTAGDFYDVIPLPNGRFGLVVADVAGKGMGAALFMALARTLLRTYALEYHDRPDFAMKVTNRRILMDTDVTMFVTVFYGVLDPRSGTLAYCNAGHSPPYLRRAGSEGETESLTRTGMALGAVRGASWEARMVEMDAGDTLVIHSDGIIDTQDEQGLFFGEERLHQLVVGFGGDSARGLENTILQASEDFGGTADQFDDITVMILIRDTDARLAA